MINKSATKAGTIRFQNGNEVSFFVGINGNTGHPIVWQKFKGKDNKFTGRNIAKLGGEIKAALAAGECKWIYRDAGGAFPF